ncbi:MAG: iron-containing alcohol dehydrogenase [Candidatus Tectomicrobia bacterium]|nr:iron-containing alcohol dehydrogenase [Candidatus Tectomicrobia bacterium]
MAFQEIFTYYLPTMVLSGAGALERLPKELGRLLVHRPCLVTDAGIVKAGLAEQLLRVLELAKIPVVLFDGVVGNPLIATVEAVWEAYRKDGCDGILALGGGSSMDVGKSLAILATNGGQISQYFGVNKFREPMAPMVAIPTTYGTGSEVSNSAVVTDPETHFKHGIVSRFCHPRLAVIEPRLMLRLPAPIAAATGADALTHAIEAYTNLQAQPLTDALALHAVRLISGNLRQAVSNDYNLEATLNMAIASTMAGIAFSNANLGICHSMAHPLGGHLGLHHGLANAIALPHVMEFCLIACPQRFADIAAAMGEEVRGLTPSVAAASAVTAVRKLLRDVGIPANLRLAGCSDEKLQDLVDDAVAMGLHKVNPRRTSREDFVRLFRRAFDAEE